MSECTCDRYNGVRKVRPHPHFREFDLWVDDVNCPTHGTIRAFAPTKDEVAPRLASLIDKVQARCLR